MSKRLPVMPFLAGLFLVLFFFGKTPATTSSISISAQTETPSESDLPVQLIISSIDLTAPIQTVGLDYEQRMEVPPDDKTASWWKYGAVPGEVGSAVIAGHFKVEDGSPGVFYNLSKVKLGDKIKINFTSGTSKAFVVKKIRTYAESEFPTKSIYASKDAKRLNLVTCSGEYNPATKDYLSRLVLYAESIY